MTILTFQDVQLISALLPALGCITTVVRLVDRVRYNRLWWDDAFAILSMVSDIIIAIGVWMHIAPQYSWSETYRLTSYYFAPFAFYGTIWAARLSILFTIIRIAPTVEYKRRLYFVAAAFGLVFVLLFAQVFWVCFPDPDQWQENPFYPYCPLGLQTAIFQLITDILSDLTLLVLPVTLVLRSRSLTRGQRIRLNAVFTSSVSTTIASIPHAYYVINYDTLGEAFTAVMELGISLIVCNLAVIVTMIFRLFSGPEVQQEESEEVTIPSSGWLTSRTFGGTPIPSRGPSSGPSRGPGWRSTIRANVSRVVPGSAFVPSDAARLEFAESAITDPREEQKEV